MVRNHDCSIELWLIIDDEMSVKSVVTIIDGSEFDETYKWELLLSDHFN